MKRVLLAALALPLTLAWAQSPFDGTWKVKPNSAKLDPKPDVRILEDGRYQCPTCVPKIDVAADGRDHPLKDSPYADTINVKVVDSNMVEIRLTKNGKPVAGERDSVQGNQLSVAWTFQLPEKSAQEGKFIETRVKEAPTGAHAISGSWKAEGIQEVSQNVGVFTFKSTGDSLDMSGSDGSSYSAKFDGKDYPYHGDPGTTSVSLRKLDANSFEETDKRNGKVMSVNRITASPDGQSITIQFDDKLPGRTDTYAFTKQY